MRWHISAAPLHMSPASNRVHTMSENDSHDRLPLRRSLLVWVGGAVLGWVVTVVAAYYFLRTEGPLTAENMAPSGAPTSVAQPGLAQSDKEMMLSPNGEEIVPIEPASGPSEAPAASPDMPAPQGAPGSQ